MCNSLNLPSDLFYHIITLMDLQTKINIGFILNKKQINFIFGNYFNFGISA